MNSLYSPVAVALILLVIRAIALPFSRLVVAIWVSIYTCGLDIEVRERRRAEIRSHIWEQIGFERELGYSPELIAVRIVLLLGMGLVPDLVWRNRQRLLVPAKPKSFEAASGLDANTELPTFAEFYRDTFPRLFSYVDNQVFDRDKSADLVSEIYERAYMVHEQKAPVTAALLIAVARQRLLAAEASQEVVLYSRAEDRSEAPDASVATRLDLVAIALARMPRDVREIISLKFDAELTNDEIAALFNLSAMSVRVSVFRALRLMREEMAKARLEGLDDDGGSLIPV